jgi:uncharacterized protein (DUF362 family)/NAD-dependent dihydropyrimidine dehydrogenase PreA subunit
MPKSVVAVVRCDSYEEPAVSDAVERGLGLLGGMGSVIRPGEKILLKPNILAGDVPEKLVSPHPAVFQAVAKETLKITPHVSYGDSPGFGRPSVHVRRPQLGRVAEALGIPLADFENGREVVFSDSPFIKRFTIALGVLAADGLISVAKFKTHGLTRITGAVKNQFGCIPGALKSEFHLKLPDPNDFGKMLVCLNLYLRPRLYVVDGITAMEGNGPRGGTPAQMNVLLISADPIALDATMCRLIDLRPDWVPTMEPGRAWGLGTYRPEEIEWVGDPLEPLINRNYKVRRAPVRSVTSPSGTVTLLRNLVTPRPVIHEPTCDRCGICVKVCPVTPKAVDWRAGDKSRPPGHTYERCIRCFCCQELCPEHAITVETPLLGRLLRGQVRA